MTEPIEASLHVSINHIGGDEIADADHVRTWLVADGLFIDGMVNGFTYAVCPRHTDPEECECDSDMSVYRAMIHSVDDR